MLYFSITILLIEVACSGEGIGTQTPQLHTTLGRRVPETKSLNRKDPRRKCIWWGTSKQHMKLQQPRNYDFRVSQFDVPRSRSGNDREMMTSPPGHHREAKIALTTTAKLQQLRANSREMTTFAESCNDREMQRPWNDELETAQLLQNVHEILRRFMAVVVSIAFRKSLA